MDKSESAKVKLTGGTIFIIILVVAIFGNVRSNEIEDKIDKLQESVNRLEQSLSYLHSRLDEKVPKKDEAKE
ncbi:hypothetical protein CW740_00925 [Kangiella profundi]|uniref:Uncharacterized protein n=1 Tax=Kangiella profundi TaxID=1561924 RepID=A0A2K9AJR5_9GAMM|nr:hypothetical protein [Kangiella profundi]AUD77872.1 hypothetical protein CW740_00925 [Kangiella profundi]GGE91819.1 hypothetical protein GCM10011356_02420 [Kangiella profundi]